MTRVRRNARKLAGDMIDYNTRILPAFPVETIHRVRTTYKKLRALVIFTRSFMPDPPAIGKPLKTYYRALGRLRNIQLLSARIYSEQEIAFCEIQQVLLKTEQKCKAEIEEIRLKRIVRKWMQKNIRKFPGKVPGHNASLYFNETFAKIQAIAFMQFIENEDLHTIRKLLKNAYYLSVMFGFWQKGTSDDWTGLMNDLGSFHDTFIQQDLINQILPEIKGSETRVHLQRKLKIWEDEAERIRKAVIEAVIARFGRAQADNFIPFQITGPAIRPGQGKSPSTHIIVGP